MSTVGGSAFNEHPIYALQYYTSTSFSVHHLEFVLYFDRNSAEKKLFLASNNSKIILMQKSN